MAAIPTFLVPPSAHTAKIRMIDTTTRLHNLKVSQLMGPPLPGFETIPALPSWSFLIESNDGTQSALYDLGVPKSWETTFAAPVVERVHRMGWKVEVEKDITEILAEGAVDPGSIGSIIWSHHHWDHLGDPSLFPPNVDLVVGPGFKKAFLPGYPGKVDAGVRAKDWQDRRLVELDFSSSCLSAGPFRLLDFFHDGSFYIVHTPGHAIGHISALVRTTAKPDSFMFLGGDLCHHGAEIRPSPYLPYPESISPRLLDLEGEILARSCPGAFITEMVHQSRGRAKDTAAFDAIIGHDIATAIDTTNKAQELDCQDNVLFVFAHDDTLLEESSVALFPGYMNDWYSRGVAKKVKWKYLRAFRGVQMLKDRLYA